VPNIQLEIGAQDFYEIFTSTLLDSDDLSS